MANRRVKLTQGQYRELTESRDWCARNGMQGMRDFYDSELAFQASRRALPSGAREYQVAEDDDRPRRGGSRPRA